MNINQAKNSAMTASILNVLAGLWLIAAPFLLAYINPTPKTNDIIVGAIITIIAVARIFSPTTTNGLSWINILLGIWLIVAPFLLGYIRNTPRMNDIILGFLVALFGLWSYYSRPRMVT